MKILITTQYMENYGAHDWDGKGECPQRWKCKGGEDYFVPVPGFVADHEFAEKNLEIIVDSIRSQIEWDDVGSRQYILGYSLVEDDFQTEFERSQFEYEGHVQFPTRVINLEETV